MSKERQILLSYAEKKKDRLLKKYLKIAREDYVRARFKSLVEAQLIVLS